ncbi:MAG: cyclic nucleotide-binding domain-containing protein [Dehalococcoidia bacterium]
MLLKRRSEKVDLLKKVPLFAGLSQRDLNEIARHADEVAVEAGKVLARQDGVGHEFVVIISGRARVERNRKLIARVRAGSFFGEMALIDGKPRTATVTAETPMVILCVHVRSFGHLLDNVPGLQRKLLVTLCERLRDADTTIGATN